MVRFYTLPSGEIMIPEQAKSEIIKRRAAGGTWTGIANWIENTFGIPIHRSTVQRWHDKEILDQEDQVYPQSETAEKVRLDKKILTYKSEVDLYKKLYNQALKDSVKQQLIIEAIRELTPAFEEVPLKEPYHPNKDAFSKSPQIVVAPLTDTHIGESVNAEQMLSLNKYNFTVFNKRLFGWANQVLNLVTYRRNIAPVNHLIIPMLGDMISGDIHEELARSNISNCMEQMIRGANLIAQALMHLAPHFKSIEVPCVVGNHGRMTRKPPMKDKYLDWDYMLYQWVAAFCKNQKNITFDISKSFANLFSVYDKKILIMHGDSVSGAGSNTSITRAITSFRGVLQYKKNLAAELNIKEDVVHFDNVMIGHFHRIDEIDIGTGELHICGCMKGPDEFALQRLHTATKPKQLVTYWHPTYGYIGKEVIYLNRYDDGEDSDAGNMFRDYIPKEWAKLIPS